MTVREVLTQQNPGALFYPDRFEAALVGMTLGFRAASETKPVAVYDHGKLIEIMAAEFAKDDARDGEEGEDAERYDDAEEWIDYHMAYAYFGSNAPVIAMIEQPTGPESPRLAAGKELDNSPSESSNAAGHDHEGKSNCLIPDCEDSGTHRAPRGSSDQTLCFQHFQEFYEHVVDPLTNPVFPRALDGAINRNP